MTKILSLKKKNTGQDKVNVPEETISQSSQREENQSEGLNKEQKQSDSKERVKTHPQKSTKPQTTHPQKSVKSETTNSLSEAEQDELIRQRFPHIIQYITLISVFYRLFFAKSPQNISLFALYFLRTPYSKTHLKKTGTILSLGIREEAEYRLSSLLLEKMSHPGLNIYTHWQETDELNASEMPDIILYIPPDRVFIISVKSLVSAKNEPVRVFYDPAVDTLRFRKGSRGKKNFPVDPLSELHQKVDWLLEHHPEMIPHKPIKIVVFANPIDLKHYKSTPVQFFGTRKPFMHHKDVYVVKENKLIQLVKILSPKPEKVNK